MKYGNKPTYCKSEHLHDSILEADYCDTLLVLLKAKKIKSYTTQVAYDLGVCVHKPDFEVIGLDGKLEVHEVKGKETAVWRLKRKMFEQKYPDIPYIVIKKVRKNEDRYKIRFAARNKRRVSFKEFLRMVQARKRKAAKSRVRICNLSK